MKRNPSHSTLRSGQTVYVTHPQLPDIERVTVLSKPMLQVFNTNYQAHYVYVRSENGHVRKCFLTDMNVSNGVQGGNRLFYSRKRAEAYVKFWNSNVNNFNREFRIGRTTLLGYLTQPVRVQPVIPKPKPIYPELATTLFNVPPLFVRTGYESMTIV